MCLFAVTCFAASLFKLTSQKAKIYSHLMLSSSTPETGEFLVVYGMLGLFYSERLYDALPTLFLKAVGKACK